MHEHLKGLGQPSYIYDTDWPFSGIRCRAWKDTWQVKIDDTGDNTNPMYFLVRKTGLDSFRLEQVSSNPWPGCAHKGGNPDERLHPFAPYVHY